MKFSKKRLRILGIALLLIGLVIMLTNISPYYEESKMQRIIIGFSISFLGAIILFLSKHGREETERLVRSVAAAGLP